MEATLVTYLNLASITSLTVWLDDFSKMSSLKNLLLPIVEKVQRLDQSEDPEYLISLELSNLNNRDKSEIVKVLKKKVDRIL